MINSFIPKIDQARNEIQYEAEKLTMLFSQLSTIFEEAEDKLNVLDLAMEIELLDDISSELHSQFERFSETLEKLPS